MRYKRSSIIIIRVYSTYIGAVRLREGIRDGSRHEDFVNTHIYIRRRGCGVPGFFLGGEGHASLIWRTVYYVIITIYTISYIYAWKLQ